jgi:hypothetical protein
MEDELVVVDDEVDVEDVVVSGVVMGLLEGGEVV